MCKPKHIALGEILSLKRGYDLTKDKMVFGTIPVVGSNGIIGFHNEYNVKSPCITIGRSGTVGIPHYYENNCWVHNTCLYIDDFKGNYPFYLYYLLKTLKLDKVASSTGVPTLNRNFVHPIKIKAYEDINIQKNIVNVLRCIDSKIELNNKLNSELEATAKDLYGYWFVQFDFPDEFGRPYKSTGGKMVYNPILKREIPEGWEVKKFDDIIDIAPKLKSIKAPDYKKLGNIPIVDQASSLITGRTDDISYLYKNSDDCVVFGDVTTCFKYINFPFAKGTDGTKIVKSKDNRIPAILLYHLIKDVILPNIGFARHYMYLRETNILLPPKSLCCKYHDLIDSCLKKRAKKIHENYKLTCLRDFLLPMLMNGQVSITD